MKPLVIKTYKEGTGNTQEIKLGHERSLWGLSWSIDADGANLGGVVAAYLSTGSVTGSVSIPIGPSDRGMIDHILLRWTREATATGTGWAKTSDTKVTRFPFPYRCPASLYLTLQTAFTAEVLVSLWLTV